jgi:hypothetical protein
VLVVVRAFRGTRRSSVYREHALAQSAFDRIVAAAIGEGLDVLPSLAEAGAQELDKQAARSLAEEVGRLRVAAVLLELDDDLTAMAAVANWCARASDDAWLRVERG